MQELQTYYNRDNKVRLGLGMYREWKEMEFPKEYYIWIYEQQGWEVDQEIDDKMKCGRVEE
jgi:hypothetical protein